jgi:hypothetical protein
MSSLLLDGDKAAVEKEGEMEACGLGGDARGIGQFARRPRAPVDKRNQHRETRWISNERSHSSDR